MTVKVSVVTTTYNHEPFIAQAIDSVLQQETTFEYEHVIGEDCSTDRTREIVLDYQRQHPGRIRALLNESNLGGRRNMVQALQACRGEYIALLEGDDCWTSRDKLQKQADFLDGHPECAIAFHGIEEQYETVAPRPRQQAFRDFYELEDLLEANFIPTCSVMCRNGLFDHFPPWFYTTPTGDWPFHVLNAHHGKIGYLDEVMAVHRIHAGGVWSPKGAAERRKQIIRTLHIFEQNLNPRYKSTLERSIARWHMKVISALAIEKRYGSIGPYLWTLLTRPDVPRATLIRAALWALRSKAGETTSS